MIDEVLIFDHLISHEQIVHFYNGGIPNNSTILSYETNTTDQWEVATTPSDLLVDGITQISDVFEFQCATNDVDCDGIPATEDCDDEDANSGAIQEEICDGFDNDCDGFTDEDFTVEWFLDSDGDGYGDETYGMMGCTPEIGFVDNNLDCDDGDDLVFRRDRRMRWDR